MFKIAFYETKKILRDYRLLVVFFLQPIILTYLVANAASHEPKDINVALYNKNSNQISHSIELKLEETSALNIEKLPSAEEVKDKVFENKAVLGVVLSLGDLSEKNKVSFITNATLPELANGAESKIKSAVSEALGSSVFEFESEKNTSQRTNYFSYFASAVIVLVMILIGISSSVTAITQERVDGTFERFFVTPYSKASMVFGKMIAYMSISLLLTVTIMFCLNVLFDVALGDIWLVALLTFMNGLAAIALGILISSFTYSIEESIQVGTLVFFALLVLTGLIFQPNTMQPVVSHLYYSMPFTYAMLGMREVNILQFGFNKLHWDLIILLAASIVFLFGAVVALKRKAN